MPEHQKDRMYTVLYVEDNRANLELVKQILSTLPNIKFLSAPHAESGIELAQIHGPDLILMDIHLPGMDGIRALKELQIYEETRQIPVIAISADALETDIQRAMAEGFKSYIVKPFDVGEFLETIDEILK